MATESEAAGFAMNGRSAAGEGSRPVAVGSSQAERWHSLGLVAYRAGQLAAAAEHMGRAIALSPDNAEYQNNRGVVLKELGELDEAIACCRRATDLKPGYAEAHYNLGNALKERGWPEEAIACYRRALELKPDLLEAHGNLGGAYKDQGKLDEALACCRRVVQLRPDSAQAHTNMGSVLEAQGKLGEAIACCRQALALDPHDAEAHSSLGSALQRQGRLDEAIVFYHRSLQFRPDYAEAHANLASALLLQGKSDEALACCRRAMAVKPGSALFHSGYLSTLAYCDGVTAEQLAGAHAEFERRHAAPLRSRWRPHDNLRDPERSLRLGFVSPDFGRHPVGRLLVRALEGLARCRCEIACYSDRLSRDAISDRLRNAAGLWREVHGLSDEQLGERIRADGVDILFDLAGHTVGNRLLVFARKPAPIQITWLGYAGSTGLRAMDYILADAREIPPEAEPYYCEKVLRVPDGYISFDPPLAAPPVGPLPAAAAGHVTFGSFNNLAKISPRTTATWAEILGRVPKSRLLIRFKGLESEGARRRLWDQFAAGSIPADRVELAGWAPQHELLEDYNRVDVALDPFPYNGGLTTCEALWMGVPVVTCPGETFASRHALGHLWSVGFTETIARDLDEYVEIAVGLATDQPRLTELRAGLRQRVGKSHLCDGKRFAENLRAILRGVWRDWCAHGKCPIENRAGPWAETASETRSH